VTEAPQLAPARPPFFRAILASPATSAAVLGAVIVFLGVSSLGPNPTWADLRPWGYLSAEAIWRGGYWALATAALVHFDLWHLAFNAYWLWTLGRPVERWAGPWGWVAFVLGAAAAGSAAELLVTTTTGIGASGVVYALFGLLWRGRSLPIFAGALPAGTAPLFLIWLVGCMVATRLGWANIANAAHVGGLCFGVLIAEWRIRRVRPRLAIAGLAALGGMIVLPAVAIPWSSRWWGHLGGVAYERGRYDKAALSFEKGLSLGLDSARTLYHLSVSYDALGDTARSRAALKVVERLNPAAAESLTTYFARVHPPVGSAITQ
jgi:rhomboid protease GluP